jgi:hypothetical protein
MFNVLSGGAKEAQVIDSVVNIMKWTFSCRTRRIDKDPVYCFIRPGTKIWCIALYSGNHGKLSVGAIDTRFIHNRGVSAQ